MKQAEISEQGAEELDRKRAFRSSGRVVIPCGRMAGAFAQQTHRLEYSGAGIESWPDGEQFSLSDCAFDVGVRARFCSIAHRAKSHL